MVAHAPGKEITAKQGTKWWTRYQISTSSERGAPYCPSRLVLYPFCEEITDVFSKCHGDLGATAICGDRGDRRLQLRDQATVLTGFVIRTRSDCRHFCATTPGFRISPNLVPGPPGFVYPSYIDTTGGICGNCGWEWPGARDRAHLG